MMSKKFSVEVLPLSNNTSSKVLSLFSSAPIFLTSNDFRQNILHASTKQEYLIKVY